MTPTSKNYTIPGEAACFLIRRLIVRDYACGMGLRQNILLCARITENNFRLSLLPQIESFQVFDNVKIVSLMDVTP